MKISEAKKVVREIYELERHIRYFWEVNSRKRVRADGNVAPQDMEGKGLIRELRTKLENKGIDCSELDQ
ncbi:MAG: hypothetical protein U9Q07_03765 [Planctomycetota bacterium]|nr:hypothetical protein [Planctomycetota bacterium]